MEPSDSRYSSKDDKSEDAMSTLAIAMVVTIVCSAIGALIGAGFYTDSRDDCMGFVSLGNAITIMAFGFAGSAIGIPAWLAAVAVSTHVRERFQSQDRHIASNRRPSEGNQLLRPAQATSTRSDQLLRSIGDNHAA